MVKTLYQPMIKCICVVCIDLSVDAMDVSGESQIDIDHHMFKQRLDLDGNPINEAPVKEDIGSDKDEKATNVSRILVIDREAREIIRLVASVRLSALSRLNRLTYNLDI